MEAYEQHDAYDFTMDQVVRDVVAQPPETLLTPPIELRSEFTWIDFTTASNPLGTPPEFTEAIVAALKRGELSYLPDYDAHALRSALSRHFNLPVEAFLCGTSVDEMIRAVAQTYQPFTKADEQPEGVGLGLALVKRHALSLGGDMLIDTDYHDGCRITIEMPK